MAQPADQCTHWCRAHVPMDSDSRTLGRMAAELTVDEAVERAMRAQDDKIAAIRDLAKGRQALADVKADTARRLAEIERENAERIGAAERDDVRLYSAATKAGWSADELRKIGFDAPAKSRRVARKRAVTAQASNGAEGAAPAAPAGSRES